MKYTYIGGTGKSIIDFVMTSKKAGEKMKTFKVGENLWARKALHGNHYNIMQNPHIDTQLSYKWLHSGQLFPETEGFVLAIQDKVIATKTTESTY
ncbi:hypothetical protein RN001_001177 [Aquatica leii]|uniref:Uncharacterized protein n=1 Tax=Aquatica leii TaxID=1421715 RepID=A0AAN7PKY7_9COLE|nr:hypothetical protein RN001_001177 [Aquatica leii]